ncbi:MAG: hypothetical protein WA777_21635 [Rhodanobacter sp.]
MIDWWKRRRERRRQQAVADLQAEVGLRLNRAIDAHHFVEGQLQPLLQQLAQVSYKVSVQQFVLEMLIASHPAIELLAINWDVNKPNLVDELHEFLPQDDEALRQAALDTWQEGLLRYSQLIERTLKVRRDLDNNA